MSGESEYLIELQRPFGGYCKDQSQNFKFSFNYKITIICVMCIAIIIIWWYFLIKHEMRKHLLFKTFNVFKTFPFSQYSNFRLTSNANMNALNWASTIIQSCINEWQGYSLRNVSLADFITVRRVHLHKPIRFSLLHT